ncbi:MAG: CBS domain-containing protein [Candidatus Micrarchaeaceae archaeon]
MILDENIPIGIDTMAYVLPDIKEIAKIRRRLGLSQKRLAKSAGISQSLLAKIESGSANPSYKAVASLFDALAQAESADSKKASDIMVRNVIVLDAYERVSNAAKLAKEYKISQFPVTKNGVYIGSVRTVDLLGAHKGEPVAAYVNYDFPTVSEDMPLDVISDIISATGRPVVVLSKGKVAGIITADDLFYSKA